MTSILIFASTAFLTAYAGVGVDYDAIIDAPKTAAYRSDLKACQKAAAEGLASGAYAETGEDEAPESDDQSAVPGWIIGEAVAAATDRPTGAAVGIAIDAANGVFTVDEANSVDGEHHPDSAGAKGDTPENDDQSTVSGAAIGAAIDAGNDDYDDSSHGADARQQNAVIDCIKQRGYRVASVQ